MADLIKNKFIQAGFAGITVLVLYGAYNLVIKILDNDRHFQDRILIQMDECTKTNAKLADALEILSETLKKWHFIVDNWKFLPSLKSVDGKRLYLYLINTLNFIGWIAGLGKGHVKGTRPFFKAL